MMKVNHNNNLSCIRDAPNVPPSTWPSHKEYPKSPNFSQQ